MTVSVEALANSTGHGRSALPTIQAQGLEKQYANGVHALRGISLEVFPGEMVGLVGSSGSGKTTLLRLLNGSLRPTAGSLCVLGEDLAALRGRRLRHLRASVATIAQQPGLVPRTSARHNVLLGQLGRVSLWQSLLRTLLPRADDGQAVRLLLGRLGLDGVIHQPVEALSGGQRQRVAVARALLQEGRVLLADEPVSSVDPDTAEVVLRVLRQEAERGRAVVVSLHQPLLARAYCSRLVQLDRGALQTDVAQPSDRLPLTRADVPLVRAS